MTCILPSHKMIQFSNLHYSSNLIFFLIPPFVSAYANQLRTNQFCSQLISGHTINFISALLILLYLPLSSLYFSFDTFNNYPLFSLVLIGLLLII